jgi:hypothetical protein
MIAKLHYTPAGRARIQELKKLMNRQRTFFDWSHLNQ